MSLSNTAVDTKAGKLIVFSAPSGTGKSTIAKRLLAETPNLFFSVSATTRPVRGGETDGVSYHFLSKPEFESKIASGAFIEYSEHFDNYYGTPKETTDAALHAGKHLLLDLDVNGALNVKRLYGKQSLLIFIKPPSLAVLRERLSGRKTESEESLKLRLERAEYEMSQSGRYDVAVVNDDLETAVSAVKAAVHQFIAAQSISA